MKTAEKKTPSLSRKRCYQCHTFIDKGQEHIFLERPFCSFRCLYRAVRAQIIPYYRRYRQTNQPTRQKPFPWALLLQALSLLLIVGLGFSLYQLDQKMQSLTIPPLIVPTIAPIDSLMQLSEYPQATVLSNTVRIAGQADDSLIISLMVNKDLYQVTLPQEGEFVFEQVQLLPGDNTLTLRAISPSGQTLVLETLSARLGSPKLNWLARDITRGPRNKKQIALTFDGGSGNGATAKILDILQEKKVHSTLFLTGNFMKHYPDLVKRMIKDGHEIANHTWSHPHLTTFALNHRHETLPAIDRASLQNELQKTSDYFTSLTHKKMLPLWRAPYGEHNLEIRRWAAEIGLRQIGWTLGHGESLDSMDWVADTTATYYRSADKILNTILSFGSEKPEGANGGIILMHLDSQRNSDHAYNILPALIDSLRQRGYDLQTVSAMLGKE